MHPFELRRHCERRLNALDRERATWFAHWRELSDFIMPRRGSFLGRRTRSSERGGKLNPKLLDATAMLAARTLASGLMAGLTSPARPWFTLGLGSPALSAVPEVRAWLDDVAARMFRTIARSNLYNALAIAYEELAVFGTASVLVVEDSRDVVRAYPLSAGEYWLAASDRLTVNTLYRSLAMTSFQLVERFGRDAVSTVVRERYDRGEWDHEVEVVHCIEPNPDAMPNSGFGRFREQMPFRSVWYERAGTDGEGRLLDLGGFEEFPALCPRWHLSGNDVYGRSPGMDALPDSKSLQLMQLRFAETLDKMVNPPMVASPQLRGQPAASTPAAITYVADTEGVGFRPAYQIKPPLAEFSAAIAARQQAVQRAFHADLFLMATELKDVRSATEIAERRAEKLVMLGPVLERLHDDLLEPLVGRVFQIMGRAGHIPPPPFAELDGLRLQPEYVSPMSSLQGAGLRAAA